MKALLEKLELGHLVVIATSIISAMLSIRQNIGLPLLHQILNPLSGFATACLTGFIAIESGVAPWLASGFAYIMGQAGHMVMDVILKALKLAKRDPIKFAASVIALIWQYILPPTKQDK